MLDLNTLFQIFNLKKNLFQEDVHGYPEISNTINLTIQENLPETESSIKIIEKDHSARTILGSIGKPIEDLNPFVKQPNFPVEDPNPNIYREELDGIAICGVDGGILKADTHLKPLFAVINLGYYVVSYGENRIYDEGSICDAKVGRELEIKYKGYRRLMNWTDRDVWMLNGEFKTGLESLKKNIEKNGKGIKGIILLDRNFSLSYASHASNEELSKISETVNEWFKRYKEEDFIPAGVYYSSDRPISKFILRTSICRDEASCLSCLKSKKRKEICRNINLVRDVDVVSPLLNVGDRTPVFEYLPAREHMPQIYFFYVKTGAGSILKVEFPPYAMEQLNEIWKVVLYQSLLTGGYPYVLARAHENSVITQNERKKIIEMLERFLVENKIMRKDSLQPVKLTRKAQLKNVGLI